MKKKTNIKKLARFVMTLVICLTMIAGNISPIFAEKGVSEPSVQESVAGTQSEETPVDTKEKEPLASIKIESDMEYHVYPLILGHGYENGRFDQIEWAKYMDPEKDDIDDFYKEYLKLSNKDTEDEEKEEIEASLLEFAEKHIEDGGKIAEEEELNEFEDLPLGIYYICGETIRPQLIELNNEDEYEVKLEKAEEEKEEIKESEETKEPEEAAEPEETKSEGAIDKPEESDEKTKSPAAKGTTRSGEDAVIKSLNAKLTSGATSQEINGESRFVSSTTGSTYIYKVSFSLGNEDVIPAGDVTLRIPINLFVDRTPNDRNTYFNSYYLDSCSLPVPAAPTTGGNGFNYTRDSATNEYVLTNTEALTAAYSGVFEFAYKLNSEVSSKYIIDGIIPDENQQNVINPNANTIPFTAKLKIGEEEQSKSVPAILMNWSVATPSYSDESIVKYMHSYPEGWGEAPADSGDYYYVTFKVKFEDRSTQAVSSVVSMGNFSHSGEVVKYRIGSGEATEGSSAAFYDTKTVTFLARFPKSSFPEPDEEYNVTCRYEGSVTGLDETTTKTNLWDRSITLKTDPEGSGPAGNSLLTYEKVGKNSATTGLELIEDNRLHKSFLNSIRTTMPLLTLTEGSDPNDVNNYNSRKYKIVIENDHYYLSYSANEIVSTEHRLLPDDYEIEQLTFAYNNSSVSSSDFSRITGISNSEFVYEKQTGVTPPIKVYAQFGTSEWKYVGQQIGSNFHWSDEYMNYEDNGITPSQTITLPNGVSAYKTVMETNLPEAGYKVTENICLHNTEHTASIIEDKDCVVMTGVGAAYVTYSDDTILRYSSTGRFPTGLKNEILAEDEATHGARLYHYYGTNTIYRTKWGSRWVNNSDTQAANNTVERQASINFEVYAWESLVYELPAGESNPDPRGQTSGTYYVLLPLGSSVNPATVIEGNPYVTSVEFEDNWKNSGRTMMIVKEVSETPKYFFYLNFKLDYAWDSIADYGRDITTLIAYKTDNDVFGGVNDGLPDNGNYRNYTQEEKDLMSDLDQDGNPEGTKKQVVYTKIERTIGVVTAASLQLEKRVKSDTSTSFNTGRSRKQVVYTGGNYSYQVHMGAEEGTEVSNMIIYDKLESFLPDGVTDSWKGTLLDVDVTQPVTKGCAPVIYYSTKQDIEFYEGSPDNDLTDSSVWSTTKPNDPTAIAIDLRKTATGENYTIEEGETLSCIINMKAPREKPVVDDIKAYNDVYMQNTIKTDTGAVSTLFEHQAYTELTLSHKITNVTGTKIWVDEDESTRSNSVTIHLLRDGTEIDSQTVTADDGWNYGFYDLPVRSDNGDLYSYSVTEDSVSGYAARIVKNETPNLLIHFSDEMADCNSSSTVRFGYSNASSKYQTPAIKMKDLAGKTALIKVNNFNVMATCYGSDEFKIDRIQAVSEGTGDYNIPFSYLGNQTYIFANKTMEMYTAGEYPNFKGTEALTSSVSYMKYSSLGLNTYDVYNYYKTTSHTITKYWNDEDESERPSSITLKLLQNGQEIAEHEVTAADNWQYTFENLPAYDANFNEYIYSGGEDEVAHYISGTDFNGVLLTFDENFSTGSEATNTSYCMSIYYKMNGEYYKLTGQGSYNGNWFGKSPESPYSAAGKTIKIPSREFCITCSTVGDQTYGYEVTRLMPAKVPESSVQHNTSPTSIRITDYASDASELKSAHPCTGNKTLHFSEENANHKSEIKNTYDTRSISGSVSWVNDNESNRPETLTVKLLRNGQVIDETQTTAADNWEYDFGTVTLESADDELSVFAKPTGYTSRYKKSDYLIQTRPTDGYYDIEEVFETRTITITKTFANVSDPENDLPHNVTVHLVRVPERQGLVEFILGLIFGREESRDETADYRFETANEYVTEPDKWIKDGNTWTYKFAIPYNEDEWEVWEEDIPTYEVSNGESNPKPVVDDAATITNTCLPGIRVRGYKEWIGDKPEDRPETITLDLYRDGVLFDTMEVPSTQKIWSFPRHEEERPNGSKYSYVVRERVPEGYNATYCKARACTGTSLTFDSSFQVGYSAYDYVKVFYKRDGTTYVFKNELTDSNGCFTRDSLAGKTINVPSAETYIQFYSNYTGTYYGFEVTEMRNVDVEIPQTETTATLPSVTPETATSSNLPKTAHNYSNYQNLLWKCEVDTEYTLSDEQSSPAEDLVWIRNTAQWKTFEGRKTWEGDDPEDRPESVTIDLLQDGEVIDTTTTSEADDWRYNFDTPRLYPRYKNNGDEYEYSVQEEPVQGYLAKYLAPEGGETNGTKISFGSFSTYNDSDYLQIYYSYNGKIYRYEDANGNVSFYGSETSSTSLTYKTLEIPSKEIYFYWYTNYSYTSYGFTIAGISPCVTEEEPSPNQLVTLPNITPTTLSGDNYPETDHNYINNQRVLWKYETESATVPGLVLDPTPEAYEITNFKNYRTFEGQKTWEGDDPEDRPESVTIDLLQDGEVVDTTTTSAAEDWHYSFSTRKIYPTLKADGTPYIYSVRERPVNDYLPSYKNDNGVEITFSEDDAHKYSGNIKIYYGTDSGTFLLKGQGSNGGNWYGEQNYNGQYSAAGKTIKVPSNKIYIYYSGYSDSKGFKVDSITPAIVDASEIESSSGSTAFHQITTASEPPEAGPGSLYYGWLINADQTYAPAVDCFDICNHYNAEEISGTKAWAFDDESERPSSVTLSLYQDGTKVDETTASASNDWQYSFGDYPKRRNDGTKYEYQIKEEGVENYISTSDFSTAVKIKYSGLLPGDYANCCIKDGERLVSVNSSFYGTRGTYVVPANDFYIYYQFGSSNAERTFKIDSLETCNNPDGVYTYTAGYTAEPVEIYDLEDVTPNVQKDGSSSYKLLHIVYGRHGKYSITNEYNLRDISGNAKFIGEGELPESVTVDLLKDGTKVDEAELSASNGYTYSFTNERLRPDGSPYVYTVEQSSVNGYTTRYGETDREWGKSLSEDGKFWNEMMPEPSENAFYIVNRYNTKTVTGKIVWEGDTPEDRPESVHVTLYNSETSITNEDWHLDHAASGWVRMEPAWLDYICATNKVGEKTVTAEDGWTYIFENVPAVNEDGDIVTYRIEEDPIKGNYSTSYNLTDVMGGDTYAVSQENQLFIIGADSLDITNTYQKKTIEGVKKWDADVENVPESVTLHLYRNGTEIAATEASSENDWKYSFGKMPVFDNNGSMYQYTIKDESEDYVSEFTEYDAVRVTYVEDMEAPGADTYTAAFRYKGSWYEVQEKPETPTAERSLVIPSEDFYIAGSPNAKVLSIEHVNLTNEEKVLLEAARRNDSSQANALNNAGLVYFRLSDSESAVRGTPGTYFVWHGIRSTGPDYNAAVSENVSIGENFSKGIDISEAVSYMKETDPEHADEYDNATVEDIVGSTVYAHFNVFLGEIKNFSKDTVISIEGKKEWQKDTPSVRPDSIRIDLLRNGEKVAETTTSESDDWEYSFDDLPKYDANGNEYTYTVQEAVVKGYINTNEEFDGIRLQLSSDSRMSDALQTAEIQVRRNGTWYRLECDLSDKTAEQKRIELFLPGEEVKVLVSQTAVEDAYYNFTDNVITIDSASGIEFPYEVNESKGYVLWDNSNNDGFRLTPAQTNATEIGLSGITDESAFVCYELGDTVYKAKPIRESGEYSYYVIPTSRFWVVKDKYINSSTSTTNLGQIYISQLRRIYAPKFSETEVLSAASTFNSQTTVYRNAIEGYSNSTCNVIRVDGTYGEGSTLKFYSAISQYLRTVSNNWNNVRYRSFEARFLCEATEAPEITDATAINSGGYGYGGLNISELTKKKGLAIRFGDNCSAGSFPYDGTTYYDSYFTLIYEGADGNAYTWPNGNYYGNVSFADYISGRTLYVPSDKIYIGFEGMYPKSYSESDPVIDIESISETNVNAYNAIRGLDTGVSMEDYLSYSPAAAVELTGEAEELHPKADAGDNVAIYPAYRVLEGTVSNEQVYTSCIFPDIFEESDYAFYLDEEEVTVTDGGELYVGNVKVGTYAPYEENDWETGEPYVAGTIIDFTTADDFDDIDGKDFYIRVGEDINSYFSTYRYETQLSDYSEPEDISPAYEFSYKRPSRSGSMVNTYGTGELTLRKRSILGGVLPGTEFGLYFADRDWTQLEDEPTAIGTVGSDGLLKFEDVPYGHYLLYETSSVNGYQTELDPWHVIINENGSASVSAGSNALTPVSGTTLSFTDKNGIAMKFNDRTDISELHIFFEYDGMIYEYPYSVTKNSIEGELVKIPSKEIWITTKNSAEAVSSEDKYNYGFKVDTVKAKKLGFNIERMRYFGNKSEFLEFLENTEIHECDGLPESEHYRSFDGNIDVYHYIYDDSDRFITPEPEETTSKGLKITFGEQSEGESIQSEVVWDSDTHYDDDLYWNTRVYTIMGDYESYIVTMDGRALTPELIRGSYSTVINYWLSEDDAEALLGIHERTNVLSFISSYYDVVEVYYSISEEGYGHHFEAKTIIPEIRVMYLHGGAIQQMTWTDSSGKRSEIFGLEQLNNREMIIPSEALCITCLEKLPQSISIESIEEITLTDEDEAAALSISKPLGNMPNLLGDDMFSSIYSQAHGGEAPGRDIGYLTGEQQTLHPYEDFGGYFGDGEPHYPCMYIYDATDTGEGDDPYVDPQDLEVPDHGKRITFGENTIFTDSDNVAANFCFLYKMNGGYYLYMYDYGDRTDLLCIDRYNIEDFKNASIDIPGAEEVYIAAYVNSDGMPLYANISVLDIASIEDVTYDDPEEYADIFHMSADNYDPSLGQRIKEQAAYTGESLLTGSQQLLSPVGEHPQYIGTDGTVEHIWSTELLIPEAEAEEVQTGPEKPVYELTNQQTETDISNVSRNGSFIEGNELQILDTSGEVVETWTTTGEAHTVNGLVEGQTYTLHQTSAVSPYETAEDITFTVNTGEKTEVIMVNLAPTDLTVSAVTSGSGSNPNDTFSYTMTITGAEPDTSYTIKTSGDDVTIETDAEGNAEYTFTLAGGEDIIVKGLPDGTDVTVTQAANAYFASYEVSSGESSQNDDDNTAIEASLSLNGTDITLQFTNSMTLPAPTGVNKSSKILLAALMLCTIALLAILKKMRTAKAEIK